MYTLTRSCICITMHVCVYDVCVHMFGQDSCREAENTLYLPLLPPIHSLLPDLLQYVCVCVHVCVYLYVWSYQRDVVEM